MNWETYIAFGDSITIGARSYLGYPEYTGKILEAKTNKYWNVLNHAVSGFKTIELARSVDTAFMDLKAHAPSVCSLLIGTNDIKAGTEADDFEIAFNLLLTKLLLLMDGRNLKIFAIPLFPPGVMYPYSFRMNELIPSFNEIIRKCAEERHLSFYPLAFQAEELFDGVHLNREGCQKMAEQVSETILIDKGL